MDDKTTIAPDVLMTIASKAAVGIDGVSRMCHEPVGLSRLFQRSFKDGVRVELKDGTVDADLYIVLKSGVNIRETSRNIQQEVTRAVSEMVGLQVGRINIHIEDIDFPGEVEA